MQALTSTSHYRSLVIALLVAISGLFTGCASSPSQQNPQVRMPLKQAWFEGKTVFYITTDASDAGAAKDLQANFAPRLAYALTAAAAADKAAKPSPSSVDKVYAFTNFTQGNVFASAPNPMGYQSKESAYTPLWLMMTVTWKAGVAQRALTSEEAVLDANERGWVVVASTGVIVNCPIVHRGADGALPEVTMTR